MVNVDLVLILSGWLCALIAIALFVWAFVQNKKMKATIEKHNKTNDKKDKDLVIPEDIKPEEFTKGVIEFLDMFWNNPHMKRRAEEIHDSLAPALKKWNDEE